jgi:hypothetical protein
MKQNELLNVFFPSVLILAMIYGRIERDSSLAIISLHFFSYMLSFLLFMSTSCRYQDKPVKRTLVSFFRLSSAHHPPQGRRGKKKGECIGGERKHAENCRSSCDG